MKAYYIFRLLFDDTEILNLSFLLYILYKFLVACKYNGRFNLKNFIWILFQNFHFIFFLIILKEKKIYQNS